MLKMQTKIRPWLLVFPCLVHVGCDDPDELWIEDDDEVVEARALAVVAPTTTGSHMGTAVGTKVIVAGGVLHAVYADEGRVKYTTSANGVTWSPAVNIGDSPAASPTIAAAADGTIGVAYRKGPTNSGEIHYLFKPSAGPWSSSHKVTSDWYSGPSSYVDEPSLVALGSTMHLTWPLSYASFPANQATPIASAESIYPPVLLCGGSASFSRPAIAVARRSATDASPRVRVAFFEEYHSASNSNCDPSRMGFYVAERQPQGYWTFTRRSYDIQSAWNSAGVSLSHAAIPSTGDFYIAVSWVLQGVAKTELFYQNPSSMNYLLGTTLLANKSIVDISAQIFDCVPRIRYAINEFTAGTGGYGPTSYRTGRWTGAQTAAPTWIEAAPVQVNTSGNNPEALFFRSSSVQSTRSVPVVYEQRVGNNFSIVEETTVQPGAAQHVPCGISPTTM